MNNGMKLPLEDRPDNKSIWNILNSKLSSNIQNIFIIDIQNDCSCSIETYDNDISNTVFHLSEDGVSEIKLGNKIHTPMMDNINQQEIINLLEIACRHAGNSAQHVPYGTILYNSADDKEKIRKLCNQHISQNITNCIALDFVSKGTAYIIPDPEFFGVITANVGKFGAFCIANNIVKVGVKNESI